MPRLSPPEPVRDLAARRATARGARDWELADSLKEEIEAAGWRVVDRGLDWRLEPAAPPDIESDDEPRYGSWRTVPSRLDSAADADFTIHLLADDRPTDLARSLAALRLHGPSGTQVVITANAPVPDQAARLEPASPDLTPVGGRPIEIVRTSARLGYAAARNIGLRRSAGAIVVLADASIEPTGDAFGPLAAVLADPRVAVAGAFGVVSRDLRRFEEAEGPRVDAIEGSWLAFRREDFAALGPLDEQFASERYLDTWWSLVLRAGVAGPPRSAVRLALPLVRHLDVGSTSPTESNRDRRARRNFYRLLERFRSRNDLLGGE